MEIWNPESPPDEVPRNKKVTICKEESFPYLDLEMYWRDEDLQFRVHLKPNQELKYLNQGSAHTKATFKAIPHGVLRRLTLLTSVNEDNKNTTLDELYPKHIEALEKAGLPLPSVYPTLNEAVEKLKIDIAEKESKEDQSKKMKKAKDNNRATYFCIGVSTGFWKTPISVTIRELSKKHGLTWLRPKMSNHRFTNLGEMLNSDLSKKVMMNIYDEEGEDRECNCNSSSKCENGECLYGGECRKKYVIYELKDSITGKSYIGKTQQFLKNRTSNHIADVWKRVEAKKNNKTYQKDDSFSRHFSTYCSDCTNSSQVRTKLKGILDVNILWQGERIQCMKTARTRDCRICMKERMTIMQSLRDDKYKVINDNSDIYSSCKCQSGFHKFAQISEPHDYYANALRTRLTQKKVTPKRKNMRVQPASPDASSPCQPVTPESDEPSLGSLLYPNLRQAQRDWTDKQARTLTSEMEAESFDC